MTDAALIGEAFQLKEVARAGWLRVGIHHPESVAAHSWGVAFLALVSCPAELDRGRVLALALLHDLAEARVGDITPHDGIPAEEKHRLEREAIDGMLADHPHLRQLWEESEARLTPEARFVKQLDIADLRAQARIYAARGADTSEFLR